KRIRIRENDVRIPPIFPLIQRVGNVTDRDMFNTFNMGVGMIVVVAKEDADAALSVVPGSYRLGEIVDGEKGVELW
ncbi:MAG: AIR synthase-related protein, partial [Sphaerochaeta sp.]|nr:AIR synthase-related protein [Sphaerochaeta sp.]